MDYNKQYIPPTVKVVAFKVEEIFQSNSGRIMLFNIGEDADMDYNSQGHEIWNTGDQDNPNNSLFDRW